MILIEKSKISILYILKKKRLALQEYILIMNIQKMLGLDGLEYQKDIEIMDMEELFQIKLFNWPWKRNMLNLDYIQMNLLKQLINYISQELYDNPEDKDEYFDAKIYIYSLSLTDEPIDLWNNKILGLKEQGEKEHL